MRFSRLKRVANKSPDQAAKTLKDKNLKNFLSVFRDWKVYPPLCATGRVLAPAAGAQEELRGPRLSFPVGGDGPRAPPALGSTPLSPVLGSREGWAAFKGSREGGVASWAGRAEAGLLPPSACGRGGG